MQQKYFYRKTNTSRKDAKKNDIKLKVVSLRGSDSDRGNLIGYESCHVALLLLMK